MPPKNPRLTLLQLNLGIIFAVPAGLAIAIPFSGRPTSLLAHLALIAPVVAASGVVNNP